MLPVTQMPSPAAAPKRCTDWPGVTVPRIVSDNDIGPGVEVVSPPHSVQPYVV